MKKLFSLLTLALLTMSAWAANTYVKVTSADQLVAGQKYIIVNEDAVTVMGEIDTYGTAIVSENNITDGILDIEGLEGVVELTLGGEEDAWTLAIDETTFVAYTGTKNTLTTGTDATALSAQWSASKQNGGFILTNAQATDRVIQYNNNSGQERFACYKGTMKDAFLFVQDANPTPVHEVAAPTLTPAQNFDESIVVTITNNEEGAALYYSTDGLAWTPYTEALTITETTTVYAKATKDGVDSPIVSAKYIKNEVTPTPEGAIVFNPSNFTAIENSEWTIIKDGVTIHCTNGTITADQFRMFKSQTTTISSTAGAIEKIVFTCTANGTTKYGPGCFTEQDGYTFEADGPTGTWEGEANSVEFISELNQVRATQIVVYLGEAPAVEVATPVLSPEHGTHFIGSQEVTITCATEGATIHYTTDSVYQVYTEPITLTETATVKAYAELNGAQSTTASAKYYKDEVVNNIAEANALENKTDFFFNGNVVVVYQNGSNLWIKDATGYGLIYGNQVGEMAEGATLNVGWTAQTYLFRGMIHEYQYPKNVTASDAALETITPTEYTESQLTTDNINERVIVKGLTLTAGDDAKYLYTADGMAIYNQFNIEYPTLEEGKTYDVEGMVSYYNEAVQIMPIAITESTAAEVLRGDVNNDKAVNISDVTALIDYLLNPATVINEANANVNLDQDINISDVTTLIDFLLSGNWPNK